MLEEEVNTLSTNIVKLTDKLETRTKQLKNVMALNKELQSLNTLCHRLEEENRFVSNFFYEILQLTLLDK